MLTNLMHVLEYYALAIVISMIVALVMKGIVVGLSRSKAKAPAAAPAAAGPPPEPAVSDIPVIAAAVYTVLGARRILHIEDTRRSTGWAHEGRSVLHTSHAVTHHSKHQS